MVRKCIVCNKTNSIQVGQSCVSCKPIVFTNITDIEKVDCDYKKEQLAGGLIFADPASPDDPFKFEVNFNGKLKSWYFEVFKFSKITF